MLSVATPLILEDGVYTAAVISGFSSVYMVLYAVGQLINGILGDFVSPRKMVFVGLVISGAATAVFPLTNQNWVGWLCFAVLGLALSMLRGPLVKIISENMDSNRARFACVFLSFASFISSFIASFLTMIFSWRWAFYVAGGIAFFMAIISLILLSRLEKKGIIVYQKKTTEKVHFKDLFSVFKIPGFFFYMIIGGVTETSGTAISFWLPTYFSEYLGQSVNFSNTTFSIFSFLLGLCPFAILFFYHLARERATLLMRIMFFLSAISFLILYFIGTNLWLNLALTFLGMFTIGCISSLLWSIYIPSLGKTGRVSSANGVLDCSGYLFAALSNVIFTLLMETFGWTGMILGWLAVAVIGFAVSLFKKDN